MTIGQGGQGDGRGTLERPGPDFHNATMSVTRPGDTAPRLVDVVTHTGAPLTPAALRAHLRSATDDIMNSGIGADERRPEWTSLVPRGEIVVDASLAPAGMAADAVERVLAVQLTGGAAGGGARLGSIDRIEVVYRDAQTGQPMMTVIGRSGRGRPVGPQTAVTRPAPLVPVEPWTPGTPLPESATGTWTIDTGRLGAVGVPAADELALRCLRATTLTFAPWVYWTRPHGDLRRVEGGALVEVQEAVVLPMAGSGAWDLSPDTLVATVLVHGVLHENGEPLGRFDVVYASDDVDDGSDVVLTGSAVTISTPLSGWVGREDLLAAALRTWELGVGAPITESSSNVAGLPLDERGFSLDR